jgi:hypothetical protein
MIDGSMSVLTLHFEANAVSLRAAFMDLTLVSTSGSVVDRVAELIVLSYIRALMKLGTSWIEGA